MNKIANVAVSYKTWIVSQWN